MTGVYFCVKCNAQVFEWIEFKGADFCCECRWQLKYLGAETATISSSGQSEAVSLVSRIRTLGPKTFVHYGTGQADLDILACVDTLKRLPTDRDALVSLGKAFMSKGRYVDAKNVLLDRVLYYPDDIGAYQELAALHFSCGELDASLAVLDRLIELTGRTPFIERNYALVMAAKSDQLK